MIIYVFLRLIQSFLQQLSRLKYFMYYVTYTFFIFLKKTISVFDVIVKQSDTISGNEIRRDVNPRHYIKIVFSASIKIY